MFIQTETTPNPNTLKFLPGRTLAETGAHEFTSIEEATVSPLAEALFQVEGVERVYFGPDFVSVSKADGGLSWSQMKAPILAAVMDHFTSGQPLFREAGAGLGHGEAVYDEASAQIVAEIKDLLDTRIRPAVAQDGGDILLDRYDPDTGVVYLHMRGACSGCPSSSATLRAGVEKTLRHYIPEVTRVEQSD